MEPYRRPVIIGLGTKPGKEKWKVRPRHWKLAGSIVVVAIFATWLAEQNSSICFVGLTCIFTLTLIIALAAFFKAYEKS